MQINKTAVLTLFLLKEPIILIKCTSMLWTLFTCNKWLVSIIATTTNDSQLTDEMLWTWLILRF